MGFTHTPAQVTTDPEQVFRLHADPRPPCLHLCPPSPRLLRAPLSALGSSSPTGGTCCAVAQETATIRRTKFKRLRPSIVPAANAATSRLQGPREEPPELRADRAPRHRVTGNQDRTMRGGDVGRAWRRRGEKVRTGLLCVAEREQADFPDGGEVCRRNLQDGSQRLR